MKKNIISLRKNLGVTDIYLSPSGEALVLNVMTTLVMNTVPPIRTHTELVALSSPAAIDEKISGAPFPNARKVTPASDSGILNLTVMNSSAVER